MKIRHYLMAAAMTVTMSCSVDKETPAEDVIQSGQLTITASFAEEDGDDDTRTALQESGSVWWNPGDAISLFYGSGSNGGSKFTAQATESTAITNFSGSIGVITGGGEISFEDTWFWATYPYNASASCDGSSITTVLPSEQVGKAGTFADNTFITIARSQGLILSFYNVCSGLKFSVTNSNVKKVSIKSNGGEKIAGKANIKFDGNGIPYIASLTDGSDEITVNAPDGGCFEVGESYYIVMFPQVLASGFTVTLETSDKYATREITKSAEFKRSVFNKMMDADKTVEYIQEKPEYEYVDLGLSVKWATFNVGATKPEEYGDYFAWGETEPYYEPGYAQYENPIWKSGKETGYDWPSYKYCSNGDEDVLTKYCSFDSKTILAPEDDAANVNWGGNWRMPTEDEIKELLNSSNCTWTRYAGGNTEFGGIAGYKVISKISGFEGNWIFLPASGVRFLTYQSIPECDVTFWSSSRSIYPDAAMYFSSYNTLYRLDYYPRSYGYPVRPVYPVPITGISLSRQSIEIMEDGTESLTATVQYENGATIKANTATWASSNESVATVDQSGKVKAVSIGTCTITATWNSYTATCSMTVIPLEPEYVDLGLSVKWATFNVGASSPEGYGEQFAWGETETKSDYISENYKYIKGNADRWLTKYCNNGNYGFNGYTDSKTVLDLEDDVAHVNWGGDWRLPTKNEYNELLNSSNCTWTWCDNGNTEFGGIAGYKVTSKIAGFVGNWIFLPALNFQSGPYRGYWDSSYGYYWSSSLDTSGPNYAYGLTFDSGNYNMEPYYRSYGMSIRPVCP